MMRLAQLLGGLVPEAALTPASAANPEIRSIAYDSREAEAGCLFFALRGRNFDGVQFVPQAVRAGTVAVVAAHAIEGAGVPVVVAENPRALLALAAGRFFGHPSRQLKLTGVTGTNGKTTTVFLLKHLLDGQGRPSGLMGTIRHMIGGEEIAAARTTPEAPDIQKMLAEMVRRGCKACVMEVSSHALDQHRADALEFDAGIFTNLTQDHLDYHGSMEAYFAAKCRLFDMLAAGRGGKAVVNADDRFGHRLADRYAKSLQVTSYGVGAQAAFRARNIRFEPAGTSFALSARGREFLVRLPLIGHFNVHNALAALAAAGALGLDLRAAVAALAAAPQVPGRMERVQAKRNFQVYVDYAHTPDALEKALRTLRELSPRRIVAVFGCGGDRDQGKRALMGRVAETHADYVVVTSDNPRSEDPEQIIAAIRSGMRGSHHECIADRRAAIERAVGLAGARDLVLLAGKGHEDYQEVQGKRTHFDDVAEARRAIAEKEVELE